MKIFKDKGYNWYLPLKYGHIIEQVITMNKKMIETAKKYGTDSFEYFKAGCDIFNREELLERLFETTKEVIELQKRNEKATEFIYKNSFDKEDGIKQWIRVFKPDLHGYANKLLKILQGDDE